MRQGARQRGRSERAGRRKHAFHRTVEPLRRGRGDPYSRIITCHSMRSVHPHWHSASESGRNVAQAKCTGATMWSLVHRQVNPEQQQRHEMHDWQARARLVGKDAMNIARKRGRCDDASTAERSGEQTAQALTTFGQTPGRLRRMARDARSTAGMADRPGPAHREQHMHTSLRTRLTCYMHETSAAHLLASARPWSSPAAVRASRSTSRTVAH